MPDGEWGLLHGETSNIPVRDVTLYQDGDRILIEASFVYRSFKGDDQVVWYERGEPLFGVKRLVELNPARKSLVVKDRIRNMYYEPLTPDWGYHITMKPAPGSKLLVPSRYQMTRGGSPLPGDVETWLPAEDNKIRTETGIIHRQFDIEKTPSGERIHCELIYPDERKIVIGVPHAPYFQTWFCNGGACTDEFTWKDGTPVFKRNWDGQGIEIGASALDHDGNVDPEVPEAQALQPGESLEVAIDFQVL